MKHMWIGAIALFSASAAVARPQPQSAAAMKDVAACRALAEDRARLACYDQSVGKLIDAEQRHDLVVIDREQVRQTRKTLFGLTLPDFNIFGGKPEKGDEIDRIETTLGSARQEVGGRWLFVLADGARWRQIDDYDLFRTPKPGDKVVVMRAALGSYKLSVGGASAVRVHREN